MRTDAFADPTFMVHVAMLGWFPLCMAFFVALGAVRGAILGLIVGLFVLPNAAYDFQGLPPYDKMMAVCVGVAVAAMIFDSKRIFAFRPRWIDLPVAVFCSAPFVSAVANGEMGAWFGLSESFGIFVTWGVPWILGRVYLTTPAALRWFAVCFVGAALVYLPFCAWEIKMSPRLHEVVYGIKLKSFKHAIRSLGWRPNVFLEHGLMAAMVIAMATLTAFWMWIAGVKRRVCGVPMLLVVALLALLTLAAQSSGALLMLAAGVGCLVLARSMRWSFPLALLVLLPVVYVGVRHGLEWQGEELVETAEALFGERRANSLQYRLDNENVLTARAKQKPWLGWGAIASFTGNVSEEGHRAIIDSMWTVLIGVYGYLGLCGAFATLLLAPFLVWRRLPVRLWGDPRFALLAVFGVILTLYAADCLLNSFPNPIFVAAAGGVSHALGTRGGLHPWIAPVRGRRIAARVRARPALAPAAASIRTETQS